MTKRKASIFMKFSFAALTSCVLSFSAAHANSTQTLNVAYFSYPPFLIEGDTPSGFIIDIEREIYEHAGYTLNFTLFPYSRALKETSHGNFDFCASLVPMAVPGLKYPEHEVAELNNVFVVKKGNTWRYTGVASLEGKKIGSIVSYDYSSISKEYNDYLHSDKAKVNALSGSNATLRMLKMIDKGRVETFNDSQALIKYTASQNGLADEFEFAGDLGKLLLTKPGFPESAEKSDTLIKIFDQGMIRIRNNGRLEEIMNKYGLKAWP